MNSVHYEITLPSGEVQYMHNTASTSGEAHRFMRLDLAAMAVKYGPCQVTLVSRRTLTEELGQYFHQRGLEETFKDL